MVLKKLYTLFSMIYKNYLYRICLDFYLLLLFYEFIVYLCNGFNIEKPVGAYNFR